MCCSIFLFSPCEHVLKQPIYQQFFFICFSLSPETCTVNVDVHNFLSLKKEQKITAKSFDHSIVVLSKKEKKKTLKKLSLFFVCLFFSIACPKNCFQPGKSFANSVQVWIQLNGGFIEGLFGYDGNQSHPILWTTTTTQSGLQIRIGFTVCRWSDTPNDISASQVPIRTE